MSQPQPPFPADENPKAAAKAAKAYAKATRPWWKKKRFIIPTVAVALVVVFTATNKGGTKDDEVKVTAGGETPSGAASTEPGTAKPKGDPGTEKNPAPRGTAVQNKSAKYQVLDVTTTKHIGSQYLGKDAAGTFVVVKLSVTNVKDSSIQFSTNDVKLQVNGTEIDASDDSVYLDDHLLYEDVSPSLTKTGTVAFDVDPAAAGQGVLKLQAIFSTDKAVYLSLQ